MLGKYQLSSAGFFHPSLGCSSGRLVLGRYCRASFWVMTIMEVQIPLNGRRLWMGVERVIQILGCHRRRLWMRTMGRGDIGMSQIEGQ